MPLYASIASTCLAMDFPRGLRDRRRIALAHLLPLRDAPAGRAIAVRRIVGAGLVGEGIGPDAALQHLGQDLGGIAEQSDAGRLSRACG